MLTDVFFPHLVFFKRTQSQLSWQKGHCNLAWYLERNNWRPSNCSEWLMKCSISNYRPWSELAIALCFWISEEIFIILLRQKDPRGVTNNEPYTWTLDYRDSTTAFALADESRRCTSFAHCILPRCPEYRVWYLRARLHFYRYVLTSTTA